MSTETSPTSSDSPHDLKKLPNVTLGSVLRHEPAWVTWSWILIPLLAFLVVMYWRWPGR